MKVIVMPPLKLAEMNGARIRTVEIYSRLAKEIEVSFVVDDAEYKAAEPHFRERLKGLHQVRAYVGRNPIRLLLSLRKVVRSAKESDAIVCYDNYKLSVAYSYLVARLSRKPLIIIVHLIEDVTRERGFFLRKAFELCKGIMALDSRAMITELHAMFPGKVIEPVTNGVDASQFDASNMPYGNETDCLFVGVLSERKGDGYLLQLWKNVIAQRPEAKLKILAGITNANKIESFKATSADYGLDKNISVLGYVSEADKIASYLETSVFVFPSIDEGFGMVISEALAAGVPSVLWDLPSFERFKEGVVKVAYPDIGSFSQAVLELLSKEDYRKAKSNEARAFAKNRLSWDAAAKIETHALLRLLRPSDN